MPLVKKLTEQEAPDILCLQETKTPDDKFPWDDVRALGYEHLHVHGMKSYNGVAILSKRPFLAEEIYHRCGNKDRRHIAIHLESSRLKRKPVEIHCLYVPAGGDEPDPAINDKFAHKLAFVDEMTGWFTDNYSPDDSLIALGDFNIAPRENDVWSHKQLLKVVSHTPIEVEKLEQMYASLSWRDAIRHFVPDEEKCYTWWSYRNRDWKKSNRGRRLDHIWITKPLAPALKSHKILTPARDWTKPSDHVPVMIDLDL